ncbi:MAG: SDR family oxidoreductase [Bacteroidota bacterium]
MEAKQILITGASGFLGYTLMNQLKDRHVVFGCYHKYMLQLPGVHTVQADLTDYRQVSELIDKTQPDAIFHLAALSNPNQCEKNPELSYAVNVSAARYLTECAKTHQAKLIFTSSDLVFDGKHAPYNEKDLPEPVNRYGRQKLEAEQKVLSYEHGTVCRMPLMFGPKSPSSGSFLQPMIQFLKASQPLNLFIDEVRTPLSSYKAAEGLVLMASKNEQLVHLSGNTAINRYDFGLLLSDILGTSKNLIIKRKLNEIEFEASRPANTSMKNDKAKKLGFNPGNLETELRRVIAEIHQ